jgi:large subunit ribosomal protein L20
MARIKRGLNAKKNHKKVLKLAKGYYGAKSKQFKTANQAVMKSLSYAYTGRKLRKRELRKLWITRINAAARIHGMSYSRFINALKQNNIEINRKMLSEMAVNDPDGFKTLVETVSTVFFSFKYYDKML